MDHKNQLAQALTFHQEGKIPEAQAIYQSILTISPDHLDALHLLGVAAAQTGNYQRAVDLIAKAISINPDVAALYINHGNALKELGQLETALTSYNKAIELQPDLPEAHYSQAIVLQLMNRLDSAVVSYNHAISIYPDYAEAYYGRGTAQLGLHQLEDAVASFNTAIGIDPQYADAYHSCGTALLALQKLEDAAACFKKTLEIKPDYDYMLGLMMHTNMRLCSWDNFNHNITELKARILNNQKCASSFSVQTLTDDSSLHRKAAEIWVNDKYPYNSSLGPILKHNKSAKIKLGYFSSDFRHHPVSRLLSELFETHDKARFELIAFSSGPETGDSLHERVKSSFHQFIDISSMSDMDAASLARQLDIDIAIDLGGHTNGSRVGIFSYRAAPVQVSYLGYLGTMGASYYDYLIADKTVIPDESQSSYIEKIAYLPSYQANDSKRPASDKTFSRAELNLPATGFVYCCLNNPYKITPTVFDSWMNILKAVPDSVLMLYTDNQSVKNNLQNEATARKVDTSRLIFCERLEYSEYLARYKAMDLFLDTLPYNAGATASDALWSGLPVLTHLGNSFPARVAASLLNAIELPELITRSQAEYEARAIELANKPELLRTIKDKLQRNRTTTGLFDTARFTKHIETAYQQMHERYHAGLEPNHIQVDG